jgi:hypothetical protein
MKRKSSSTHLRALPWSDCGPLRFVLLSRLSDDEQSKGADTSLDAQERLCRAAVENYIESFGGEIVATLRGDKTGTTLKRSDWREAMSLAEGRAFDVLVSVRMDRVARGKVFNVAEHLLLEEKVVVWLTEDTFAADAGGQTMKQVYVLRDGMYPLFVSQAVKSHQADALAQGFWPGGHRAFGITTITAPGMEDMVLPGGKVKRAPRVPRHHPSEAPCVVEAFRLMVLHENAGEVQSYLRIVDPSRSWEHSAVDRLLSSEIYRGVVKWGPNENRSVPGFPPIIDEETWNRVQQIRAARAARREASEGGPRFERHAASKETGEVFPYYLRERVRCAACGTLMTPASHKGKSSLVHYYECTRIATAGHASCPVKRVNANALHEAVIGEIARCGAHPTRLTLLIREAVKLLPSGTDAKVKLERLERNRRETGKKAKRIIEAIKSGLKSPALSEELRELDKLAAAQDKDILAAREAAEEMQGQRPDAARVAELLSRFSGLWDAATTDERQRLLRLMVETVQVRGKSEDGKKIEGNLQLILEIPPSQVCALSGTWVPQPNQDANALFASPFRVKTSPRTCNIPLSIPRHRRAPERGRARVPIV